MLKTGDILNEAYRIDEQIGVGGGGIIFKAYHLRMEKYVAIKLIKDEVKGILKNRAEVDLLKNLRHEYIPQVYDFIEDGNDVYTVMDFIEGENMKQIMSGGKKFSEAEIKKYALELCDAVAYLHHKNPPIIHSDIKPENIMLTPDDNICLIDFNISMMSSGKGAASLGGSKGFAAPEQYKRIVAAPAQVGEFHEDTRFISEEDIAHDTVILDENGDVIGGENESAPTPSIQIKNNTQKTKNLNNAYVDTRTDIYGMGATLYNLLTGRIRGENGSLDFRGTSVSSNMQNVIRKAMNTDPEKRFRTVEEMKKAIAGGKNTLMVALSAVACVAVICAAVIFGMINNRDSVETIAEAQTSPAQTTSETTTTTATEAETEIEETQTELVTQVHTEASITETAVTENTPVSNILGDSKYYEYMISTDNVKYTAEEFNNDKAIEEAIKIVIELDEYKEDYSELEEIQERYPDQDCSFELSFAQGITADFDKNGSEESFFIVCPIFSDSFSIDYHSHSYLFYCNNSTVKYITWCYWGRVFFDGRPGFGEIVYNDFSHLFVDGGGFLDIKDCFSAIYSVNNDEIKCEIRAFNIWGSDQPDIFLCVQDEGQFHGIIFWDNEEKCYKCPELVELSEDEINQVEGLSELVEEILIREHYQVADLKVWLVGNKYYTIYVLNGPGGNCDSYVLEEGKLIESDFYVTFDASDLIAEFNSPAPYPVNVDFYQIEREMERLSSESDPVLLSYKDIDISKDTFIGNKANDDFRYSEYENHIEILEYIGNDEEVIIPEKINGKWVMVIKSAFSKSNMVKSILLPESVVKIMKAFTNCNSLETITIPYGIEKIENYAFKDCTSLKSVTIPNSVKSIGEGAFAGCTSLESIILPDGVTDISQMAFWNCTSLREVIIPGSVTSISYSAFDGCCSLESVIMLYGIKIIPEDVFCYCTSLKSITIPDSVTEIGGKAFKGCTSLKEITIPESVTEIGNSAFYNCSSLESIILPDGITEIPYRAFSDCTSLKEITIPESVTTIDSSAFSGCTSLTEINASPVIAKIISEQAKSIS